MTRSDQWRSCSTQLAGELYRLDRGRGKRLPQPTCGGQGTPGGGRMKESFGLAAPIRSRCRRGPPHGTRGAAIMSQSRRPPSLRPRRPLPHRGVGPLSTAMPMAQGGILRGGASATTLKTGTRTFARHRPLGRSWGTCFGGSGRRSGNVTGPCTRDISPILSRSPQVGAASSPRPPRNFTRRASLPAPKSGNPRQTPPCLLGREYSGRQSRTSISQSCASLLPS